MNSSDRLLRGRKSYDARLWGQAFEDLSAADRDCVLDHDDLERLAFSAYFMGRDQDTVTAFDRAYRQCVDAGLPARAARCAFWLGLTLLLRGEAGAASGWLSRGERQVGDIDCVETGYFAVPRAELSLVRGDGAGAHQAATLALSVGTRFKDLDLIAIALHLQGRALIQQWQVRPGLALLDEAMVAVTTDDLSPMVTGLIYCSVIEVCQQTFALKRAREWTLSFTRWCEEQPDIVAFTATCRVCRAEVFQYAGHWRDAMHEAELASQPPEPPARAFYQQAEIHRLRGENDLADAAYRQAGEGGYDPQPGLCLLRLNQGQTVVAGAMIQRAVHAAASPQQKARLLPAYIETLLALGELDEARAACKELASLADDMDAEPIRAMSAQAQGSLALALGDPSSAISLLRTARQIWEHLGVPYEMGRSRVLIGIACDRLGDEEGSRLEFDGAASIFRDLGAATELDNLRRLSDVTPGAPKGLTSRELEVLRLISTGLTNKAIAEELHISQKTVDRHVSNIFMKLDVSTRTAATVFAYENKLV